MSVFYNAYEHQELPADFGAKSAKLGDDDKKRFLRVAQEAAAKLVAAENSDDFGAPSTSKGVTVSLKPAADGENFITVRAKINVPGTLEQMQRWQAADTSDQFCTVMSRIDPMFLDGRNIVHISGKPIKRDGAFNPVAEPEYPFCAVRWGAFKAPWPVWSRDMLFLEYDGEVNGAFVQASVSVELDDCPSLEESNKFVRGKLFPSGYVWRQIDAKTMSLTYIVQMDTAGSIPVWVQNMVAPQQAQNVTRIRDSIANLEMAHNAINEAGGKLTSHAVDMSIDAGKVLSVDIHVPGPGWQLSYEFVPKDKDIGVRYDGVAEKEAQTITRGGKNKTLVAGVVTATGTKLTTNWDNSYSRWTGKVVYARHVLIPPEGTTATNAAASTGSSSPGSSTGGAGGGAGASA